MEKIGEIVHLAKSGRLIVKIEENINHNLIGQSLIDDRGTKVGKIIELIGSVKSPYASVIPTINSKYSIGGVVYRSQSLNHQFNSSKKRDRVRRKRT
ncbi:MAG TPA: Gar1/Naf1 family protein [Nitrososphaeraceae archaeon]|jgi:rRNA processing protein Gar1|nr:Gar1/Naf1 family protein [Nitrososphaeraceae archaeon]